MTSAELRDLVRDRPLVTPEIHQPNDYYGNASTLKRYAGLPQSYQIKAAIEHGPYLDDSAWDCDTGAPVPGMLYCATRRAKVLRSLLKKAFFAVGPIIQYAEPMISEEQLKQEKLRRGRILLAMPAKSTHWSLVHYDVDTFCRMLAQASKHFDSAIICLGWNDILHGAAESYMDRGYECTTSGHMFDLDFLRRLKTHILVADAVVTNVVGTHIGYSVALGKPTSIISSEVGWDTERADIRRGLEARTTIIKLSHERTEKHFAGFHEILTDEQREYVREYWGTGIHRSPSEMRLIFDILDDMHREGLDRIARRHNPMVEQALLYLNEGQNEKAAIAAEAAAVAYPEIPQIDYGRALALARLGETDRAKALLEQVVRAAPSHTKARTLLSGFDVETNGGTPGTNDATVSAPTDAAAIVNELMNRASAALERKDLSAAFGLLNRAKAEKVRVRGLDLVRASIFLQANQILAAREVLLEELRFFPDNHKAQQLLNRVNAAIPHFQTTRLGPPEFRDLYCVVRPYTMLSQERLLSLYTRARQACDQDIPGDFVECGVAAGGSSALLAYVIKVHSRRPRRLHSFDTFEGMPEPGEHDVTGGLAADTTGWGEGTCAAPEDSLREICGKLQVMDFVNPVKGLFQDTLPTWKNANPEVAFLHLDGDWYESTKTVLEHVYDLLVDGSCMQLDDYEHWSGVVKAVREFEEARGVKFAPNRIDGNAVWMTKPGA